MRCYLRQAGARYAVILKLAMAVALALAQFAGGAPLQALTSQRACAMACCAGKLPHAAGSCKHGACHVDLSIKRAETENKTASHCATHGSAAMPSGAAVMHDEAGMSDSAYMPDAPAASVPMPEQSHGTVKIETVNAGTSPEPQVNDDKPQPAGNLSARVMGSPCPQDCGAGAFNYTNQSRPREQAALAFAVRPRPPSAAVYVHSFNHSINSLDALRRSSVPRAPPRSFS